MDAENLPLVAVAVVAAVVFVVVVMVVLRRSPVVRGKRITEDSAHRMQTASKLGLQYASGAAWTRDKKWADGPFGVGSRRRGDDIMFGVYADRPVAAFYHTWELVEPKRQDYAVTHLVAGVWIGGDLPLIRVYRETGVHNMPGDVLTGHAPFDLRYRVLSGSQDAVRQVFTANVARFVLSNDEHVGEFWFQNGWLFTAWERDPSVAEPVEYRYYLSFLTGLARTVPEQLRTVDAIKGPNGNALAENAVRDLFPSLKAKASN